MPVVLIERTLAAVSPAYLTDSVCTDHELGTGLAVRHLATQGHTRIGLLTSSGSPTSAKVRRGWLQALEELGLPEIADSHQKAPEPTSDVRAGYGRVLEVLRRRKLTAMVVHSDPEAIALMQHADDAGIRIPGDLAVVSYDDEVAAASDPQLTAVRPPKADIGALAVEMLVARMAQGESRPIHTTALTPRLIVRESCGASLLPTSQG